MRDGRPVAAAELCKLHSAMQKSQEHLLRNRMQCLSADSVATIVRLNSHYFTRTLRLPSDLLYINRTLVTSKLDLTRVSSWALPP